MAGIKCSAPFLWRPPSPWLLILWWRSGGAGGGMVHNIGSCDELARGTGKVSGVTRVPKRDKRDDGDEPSLPIARRRSG